MKLHHLAIWTHNLEATKTFYQKWFNMVSSKKYVNPTTGLSSYFLGFNGETTCLELMHRPDITAHNSRNAIGLSHVAISVGSKDRVNQLTQQMREAGCTIVGEPRTTGDGFYESVVLDPEGNCIELTE